MSIDKLQQELLSIECQLSPENLWRDGEAPRAWVRKEQARLERRRATILKKLAARPWWATANATPLGPP